MITLYQLEYCPWWMQVRNFLSSRNIPFQVRNVEKLHSQRKEVFALGLEQSDVPVVVDGDVILQDSQKIMEYLDEKYGEGFGEPRYGITRTLEGVAFGDAVPMVKEALAKEGFGVLTEIDVKATMKKKLDVDFQNYSILGACNPPLAHQALSAEPAIGLLLPCNVVGTEDNAGNAVVSALDPKVQFTLVKRDDVDPLATAVREKLVRALDSI